MAAPHETVLRLTALPPGNAHGRSWPQTIHCMSDSSKTLDLCDDGLCTQASIVFGFLPPALMLWDRPVVVQAIVQRRESDHGTQEAKEPELISWTDTVMFVCAAIPSLVMYDRGNRLPVGIGWRRCAIVDVEGLACWVLTKLVTICSFKGKRSLVDEQTMILRAEKRGRDIELHNSASCCRTWSLRRTSLKSDVPVLMIVRLCSISRTIRTPTE